MPSPRKALALALTCHMPDPGGHAGPWRFAFDQAASGKRPRHNGHKHQTQGRLGGFRVVSVLRPRSRQHVQAGLVRAHKKPRRRTRARLALLADPGLIFF